jgi:hypothetical protein
LAFIFCPIRPYLYSIAMFRLVPPLSLILHISFKFHFFPFLHLNLLLHILFRYFHYFFNYVHFCLFCLFLFLFPPSLISKYFSSIAISRTDSKLVAVYLITHIFIMIKFINKYYSTSLFN